MSTFDDIKKSLESNKIFFETVAAAALSLMSVLVSMSQWRSVETQNKILGLQTKIAEIQAMPRFQISLDQVRNTQNGHIDENDLNVVNQGGPAKNFAAEAAYFMDVSDQLENQRCEAILPINDYFDAALLGHNDEGEMVKMVSRTNNTDYSHVEAQLLELAKDSKHVLTWNPELLVRISYTDILDDSHIEFYEVHAIAGATRMDDALGKSRFSLLKESASTMLSLHTLTGNLLLKACREHLKTRIQ
jgi:hypothetical protein